MDRVSSSDGTPIAVWSRGAGPPLLLVHGTTADHTRWARTAPRFATRFRVYAMDRRGRGESGDAGAYSIEQEGADVAAVVDHIGTAVDVIGHSYGAICAIEAAARTDHLRKLVLYEPPIPVGLKIVRKATREKIDELIHEGRREEALLSFFREVVGAPEAQLAALRRDAAWPGRVAAVHTVSRELRIDDDYQLDFERLRSIATPTLLLLGGDSPAFFHEAVRHLDAALPNSRVHVMPGQQHIAMDMIPDEFAALVTGFLNE